MERENMENSTIIMRALDYIEKHLDETLNLDKIADYAGYSKFHLNRLFAEMVGCTMNKYIRNRRLTIAAEKLIYSNQPIIEIAYEANYNSQQAFTFAFRQLYLHTPQEYRWIGNYTPKQNRFTINNRFTGFYGSTMKCRAAA